MLSNVPAKRMVFPKFFIHYYRHVEKGDKERKSNKYQNKGELVRDMRISGAKRRIVVMEINGATK